MGRPNGSREVLLLPFIVRVLRQQHLPAFLLSESKTACVSFQGAEGEGLAEILSQLSPMWHMQPSKQLRYPTHPLIRPNCPLSK